MQMSKAFWLITLIIAKFAALDTVILEESGPKTAYMYSVSTTDSKKKPYSIIIIKDNYEVIVLKKEYLNEN